MKKTLAKLLIPCFSVLPYGQQPITQFELINPTTKIDFLKTSKRNINYEEFLNHLEKKSEERRKLAEQEKARLEQIRKQNVNFYTHDISIPSGITANEMYSILKDTGMSDVASYIVEGEKQYGINALILAALVAEESGWGKSSRATGPTKNMTGYAVQNNRSKGKSYVHRGHSVLDSASLLKDYITPGGKYDVHGTSLKKVGNLYCAIPGYDERLTSIATTLLKKYKKINLQNS